MHAGSNIDLVPLLYQPAQFEAKLADAPGGSAPPGAPPPREAPSVLDALHSLNQQCHVFKKSAEQLGKAYFTVHKLAIVYTLASTRT